jgi:hypothetical protein
MVNPLGYDSRFRIIWITLIAIVLLAIPIAYFVYLRYHNMAYLGVMLGCEEVEGVVESGFHYQEQTDSKPFRWTNGAGRLYVPVNKSRPPTKLWVSIETFRPTKEPIRFQVVVDGENLYDGEVPAWKWEETFDLTSLQFSDKTMIELRSETFVPKGVMDEGLNTDTRVLGVQVQGVMLSRDD